MIKPLLLLMLAIEATTVEKPSSKVEAPKTPEKSILRAPKGAKIYLFNEDGSFEVLDECTIPNNAFFMCVAISVKRAKMKFCGSQLPF